jgi:hypothetical protein
VATTSYTKSLTGFTVAGTGSCTLIYTLTDVSGAPIDTMFTFSDTALTLAMYTTSTSKIGTYNFILTGYLDSVNS